MLYFYCKVIQNICVLNKYCFLAFYPLDSKLSHFRTDNTREKNLKKRVVFSGHTVTPSVCVVSYLRFALRRKVFVDKQRSQSHAEVFVGLRQAEPAQFQLLLRAVNLPRKLVDGAPKGGGQVFA